MLKRILVIGAAIVAVLAIATYTVVPRHIAVSRSATIEAEPARVFAVLNGFSEFQNWSPWNTDPEMKVETSGPQFGVGARMTWHSDKQGSGAQEIVRSVQDREVAVKIAFEDYDTPTEARYVLEPVEGGTRVTWSFGSDMGLNPVTRWFGLIIQSSVGEEYEQGLKNLKAYIESGGAPRQPEPEMGHTWLFPLIGEARAEEMPEDAPLPSSPALPPPSEMMQPAQPGADSGGAGMPAVEMNPLTPQSGTPGGEPELVTLTPRPMCYVDGVAPNPEDPKNADAVSQTLGAAYGKCGAFIGAHSLVMTDAPLAITREYVSGQDWKFRAAIAVKEMPAVLPAEAGGVSFAMTPGGRAIKAVHQGSYQSIDEAYARISEYAEKNGLTANGGSIEEYISDPGSTPEAELITNVYYLVK